MKNNYIGMLSTLLAAQMNRIPPLGCKEYFFNKDGKFSTESMRRTEVAYYCHAINDKSAIKKFKKWQIKQIN